MGLTDDEEGRRVQALYGLLQGDNLLLLDGDHEHLLFRAGIAPLPVENGDPTVDVVDDDPGNLPVLVADDIGHLGQIHAVEDAVHDDGGNIEGDQTVHGAVKILKHHGHGHNHHQVDGHEQLAHREPGHLQLEQAGNQIGPPGGGPLEENDTDGAPHGQSAENTGQHGFHGLEGIPRGQQVDEYRRDEHGIEGGHQQMTAQQPPAQQKEGDVQ